MFTKVCLDQKNHSVENREHGVLTVEAITLDKTSNYPYKGVVNLTKDLICWSLPERCGGDRLPTDPGDILRVLTHHTEIKAFLISNSRNH